MAALLDHWGVEWSHARESQGWRSILCPVHSEDTPSFRVNVESGAWKCLGGETEVQTREGVFPIAELAGKEPELLTSKGWRKAPIFSFGEDELLTLTVSRNGVERTIRATADHRWLTRGYHEVVTANLNTGHRLRSVSPPRSGTYKPTVPGIMHGFTFGDGHREEVTSVATFHGEKDAALRPYFSPLLRTLEYDDHARVYDLPRFYKDLPAENEFPGYLYGFLAGYFAADGNVTETGLPQLASASRKNLEWVKHVALTRLGVVTHDIRTSFRVGMNGFAGDMHYLSFSRKSLDPGFFLIPDHRQRFEANREVNERLGYAVKGVERTGERDEVFCAVVEGVGNFALSGNLLTGNCMSCGIKGGDTLDLIAVREGLEDFHLVVEYAESVPGERQEGDAPARGRTRVAGKATGRASLARSGKLTYTRR